MADWCDQAPQTSGRLSTFTQQGPKLPVCQASLHRELPGHSQSTAAGAQDCLSALITHQHPERVPRPRYQGQLVSERALQPGRDGAEQLALSLETSDADSRSICQEEEPADTVTLKQVGFSQDPADVLSCGSPLQELTKSPDRAHHSCASQNGLLEGLEAACHSCGQACSETLEGEARETSIPQHRSQLQAWLAEPSKASSSSSSSACLAAAAQQHLLEDMAGIAKPALPAVNVSLQDWNFRGLQSEPSTSSSQPVQVMSHC